MNLTESIFEDATLTRFNEPGWPVAHGSRSGVGEGAVAGTAGCRRDGRGAAAVMNAHPQSVSQKLRMAGRDYTRRGWVFVTLSADDHRHLFGGIGDRRLTRMLAERRAVSKTLRERSRP